METEIYYLKSLLTEGLNLLLESSLVCLKDNYYKQGVPDLIERNEMMLDKIKMIIESNNKIEETYKYIKTDN